MPRSICTAVAAIASCGVQREALYAMSAAGISLLGMAENGHDAWQMVAGLRPDLLLADMELPIMEGSSLARRISGSFSLPVRPAVVLLRHPAFPVSGADELASSGVILLDKPVTAAGFRASIEGLRSTEPIFSPIEMQRADLLLEDLGVPDHIGRKCLMYAALLGATDERCLCNLGGLLYPQIGKLCGLNAAQAERAIRHAIDLAWQSDKFDNQYRIFADTVDAGRGQPTCGEMIFRLADILRLEG